MTCRQALGREIVLPPFEPWNRPAANDNNPPVVRDWLEGLAGLVLTFGVQTAWASFLIAQLQTP